jgi:alkaline phosphatase D
VFAGDSVSDGAVEADRPVRLLLRVEPSGGSAARLTIAAQQDGRSVETSAIAPAALLQGNIALSAESPRRTPEDGGREAIRWRFSDWTLGGPRVAAHPGRAFGPVLWSQYTLSRGVLKLSAQFPPLGEGDAKQAALQVKRGGAWTDAARADIDPMARTAVFRIEGWDPSADVPCRVAYRWLGLDHHWEGTIRRDPVDRDAVSIAAFSCDIGTAFPQPRMVRNVSIQNPDVLCFLGDQIYESYGGFGMTREPVDVAMLDYLRKYYQFGWTWRELLKDRPSVIIPDDHDVFQGNLWGHGGRPLPMTKSGKPDFAAGGYAMPPEWVRAVERTQTGHLPDPADPEPVDQGIGVYFTDMVYGRISFAILEDRKFKTGPASAYEGNRRSAAVELDPPGAQLLGERQEKFLRSWAADWRGADMKVALSQTIFCKVTTHAGQDLKSAGRDMDCGGWPPAGRRRALEEIRRGFAFSIHGDQHSGALVHHGLDTWEDANVALLVMGTANGFPRAWWPDAPGENHVAGRESWTGRYRDPFGNLITVLAAGNPEKGSNTLRGIDPQELAHLKGSGHGIIRFDKSAGTATFELWRHEFDAAAPKPGDQFPDFPQTYDMTANYGRAAVEWLPALDVTGMVNPVVEVIDESDGTLVYALRIRGSAFQPRVFKPGVYTLRVGEPGTAQIEDPDRSALRSRPRRRPPVHLSTPRRMRMRGQTMILPPVP